MTASTHPQGVLDTDILILRRWIDPDQLPFEMAISAVTLAELSGGPIRYDPTPSRTPMLNTPHGHAASTLSRGSRTS